jgi:hypothetical protein
VSGSIPAAKAARKPCGKRVLWEHTGIAFAFGAGGGGSSPPGRAMDEMVSVVKSAVCKTVAFGYVGSIPTSSTSFNVPVV